MNKREYKKRKRKNTVHDLRECPKARKNGWEAEVPKTEKTFLQISLVSFFWKFSNPWILCKKLMNFFKSVSSWTGPTRARREQCRRLVRPRPKRFILFSIYYSLQIQPTHLASTIPLYFKFLSTQYLTFWYSP